MVSGVEAQHSVALNPLVIPYFGEAVHKSSSKLTHVCHSGKSIRKLLLNRGRGDFLSKLSLQPHQGFQQTPPSMNPEPLKL